MPVFRLWIIFLIASTSFNKPAFAAQPFGVNGDWDFVDTVKSITGWSSPTGAALALDVNGWPMGDAQAVIMDERRNMPWRAPDAPAVNENLSGTYLLSFSGQAVIAGSTDTGAGVLIQNQNYNSSTNITTAQVVFQPGHWFMQLTFTNTQRNPGDTPGTGFTGMSLLRPGYPANTTQIFTNGTLKAYAQPFAANRFLGPDATNNYQNFYGTTLITTTWATRVQVTDAYQGGLPQNQTGGNQAWGDAWEYMILLSNQTNHDMWINIPASADDDYCTQLATLIKNGNQYTAGLNPNLHVYLEYSNEVWNFGFQQATYNQIQAQDEGITNDERYVERTIQIAQDFENVFGPGSLNTVIRPVALWQYTTEAMFHNTLAWAEQRFAAPVKTFLWGVGEAAYYNPTDTSTVANIFNTLWTGSDTTRVDFVGWQAVASYFGLKEVAYESGPSLVGGTGAYATRNSEMIPSEMHHFLANWFAVGGDLINFFAMRGAVGEFGDFLLIEDYEHLNTPKYEGAVDIMNADQPAITAGHVLPWTSGATATLDPSQCVPNPFSPQAVPGSGLTITPGSINDYLLRAPIAGTYSFTLYGSAAAGAQVAVYVDDQLISTITLPTTAGNSAPVSVTVAAGFHGMLLTGTGSGNSTLPAGSLITVALKSAGGKGVVPSAPMNLTGTIARGTATLLWATESTAGSYNVYRSTKSGGSYQKIANTASNTYTDSTVTNGTTYYYVITAHNSIGQSAYSMQIPLTPTTTGAPAAPIGVTLNIKGGDVTPFFGGGSAIISWQAVPDAVTYNVERATVSGGPYTTVINQIGLSYNDLSVVDNTTYYYVIAAVNSYGTSSPSQQVSGTTTEVTPVPPTALTASVPVAGEVFLKWTPQPTTTPEFETAFNVQRGTTSGGPYTTVISLNTYNYMDITVTTGTTYYYVVSQTNAAGTSTNSAEVSVTP